MTISAKDGGLPPDSVVQDDDEVLADCERLVAAHHDPTWGAMVRVALAPCSRSASARSSCCAPRNWPSASTCGCTERTNANPESPAQEPAPPLGTSIPPR